MQRLNDVARVTQGT